MDTSHILDAISKLGVVAILISGCITWMGIVLSRRHERRKLLQDQLERGLGAEVRANLLCIAGSSPTDLLFDEQKQILALETLIPFQRIASHISSRPRDWTAVLSYTDHANLVAAVRQSSVLLQVLQRTTAPMARRAWNGHRRRAMRGLLKSLRIKLEAPR